MPRIVTTYLASLDAERLRQFLQSKNPAAASRAAAAIREGIGQIAAYPEGYKPVPNMPYHREMHIKFGSGGYTVRYHYEPGGDITILRMRHQRENDFSNLTS
jgi:plasmid stabilization system protein ParE